jgi:hypothetical protein
MSVSARWDMAEQLLREAEEALRRPPRNAAKGHARVQGAQAELAWLRQQQQEAVDAALIARELGQWVDPSGRLITANLGMLAEAIARRLSEAQS